MRLKISDVLEIGKPVPAQNGKTYYSWLVSGRIEGESADRKLIELKSGQDMNPTVGMDLEISPGKEYQGKIPYWIKPAGGSGYQGKPRVSYTLDEYNRLWEYTMKRFEAIKDVGVQQKYRATYLIGAKDLGIKIGEPIAENDGKEADFFQEPDRSF